MDTLCVFVDPCGEDISRNVDPAKEFVTTPGWLLAVGMLVCPQLCISTAVRGSPLQDSHEPQPSCSSPLLLTSWRGVNVWQLPVRSSGVVFWGGVGKLQPCNYCQSAPECGDQSSVRFLSGAKVRPSPGYNELDLRSLRISNLLGPEHSKIHLSGARQIKIRSREVPR